MSVKKIFTILITIVACVVIGALVLNVIMPNAINQGINTLEKMIADGTGMQFDLNGDGHANMSTTTATDQTGTSQGGVGVDGFQ